MRRFLIDTDTASDDAVAILMAHRWPDVQVDAVTIVAGNVPVEMGARNAGYSIELCGKSTPVFHARGRVQHLGRPGGRAHRLPLRPADPHGRVGALPGEGGAGCR